MHTFFVIVAAMIQFVKSKRDVNGDTIIMLEYEHFAVGGYANAAIRTHSSRPNAICVLQLNVNASFKAAVHPV